MNCSDEFIGGYLDQELDLSSFRLSSDIILRVCGHCSEIYANLLQTQRSEIRLYAILPPLSGRLRAGDWRSFEEA